MTTEEPVGLRARQKLARREALIDSAHRLVERDGLEAVTVDAICADAGVSTRTFFNYFESKDDAVLGLEPLRLDPVATDTFAAGGPAGVLAPDLLALARSILEGPALDGARMAAAAELARREPRLVLRHVAWMERYREEVEDLMRRRFGDDPGRAQLVELGGMALMVLVRGAMQRWEAGGGRGDVPDHLAAVRADLHLLLLDA